MSRRLARVLGLVMAALLVGCASTRPVRPADPAPNAPTSLVTSDPGLESQRKQAGIADCPPSSLAAVDGGLPDLTLGCLGGGATSRLGSLRGPLVVNVWAQWCGPCRAEAPYLKAAAEQRPNVAFVGIDYHDPSPDRAIEFAKQVGWRWPQLWDPNRISAAGLSIVGPPMTLLVNADGKVVYRHVGQLTSTEQLLTLIDQRLGS